MPGVRIRHTGGLSNVCYLVPVLSKPYTTGPIDCPTCQTLHPVKTVHLWLEPDGSVLVSEGVLGELRMAGMPELEVLNEVAAPPPLRLGRPVGVQKFTAHQEEAVKARREWRVEQDKKNRRINLGWLKLNKGN